MAEDIETTPVAVWGCAAIGRVVSLSEDAVYWHLKDRRIPARKCGRKWVADLGELHRWLKENRHPAGE
jgi:hypothetical protein